MRRDVPTRPPAVDRDRPVKLPSVCTVSRRASGWCGRSRPGSAIARVSPTPSSWEAPLPLVLGGASVEQRPPSGRTALRCRLPRHVG